MKPVKIIIFSVIVILICLSIGLSILVVDQYIYITQGPPYEPTPLHIAALHGDINTVKLYINSPSEINKMGSILGRMPDTPLTFAIQGDHNDIAILLIEHGADLNLCYPLYHAIHHNNLDMVKLLIEKGANINIKFSSKRTPLHLAVIEVHTEIVKLLLEKGANPNTKDQYGNTSFDDANSEEMKQILLSQIKKTKVPK